MNTSTYAKPFTLALLLLLSACGGGGSSTSSSDSTSATNLVDWTWVGGKDWFADTGSYGSKGITVSSNMPQALEGAMSWTDDNGNLWLFGGGGVTGPTDFSDMWKYDGANWTWMNGPAAPNSSNQQSIYGTKGSLGSSYFPGARQYSATWKDSSGSLWLFGGYIRTDSQGTTAVSNDLWKYNIGSNQWAWMNGVITTNSTSPASGIYSGGGQYPGARWGSASWTDSAGNFWLFGGFGRDEASVSSGYLNDLWKFNTSTNQWTWVGGAKVIDQPGSYSTPGSMLPGARSGAVSWADSTGNLWLFGGVGYDSAGSVGNLNDLWKFDGANWTWVKGSNLIDRSGTYGTPGSPSMSNIPGARRFAVSWKDNSGNFWLFGGSGYDSAGNFGLLNDLWEFDGANWTWMSGSNIRDQIGEFGTRGNPDPTRFVPGSRDVAVSWYDSINSRFWLFGGQGYDADGSYGYLNDLWKFQPKP